MITARIQGAQAEELRFKALLRKTKNPSAMMLGGGRAVANRLKKHFRDKNKNEPNKLGGKRENFWNKVAQSVQAPEIKGSGLTVTIAINDPRFAQKVFGGTIRAKRVRNLSIPVSPEAYGRAPRTFEAETGLKLIFIKQNSNIFLASVRGAGLQVEYLLTPSVHQDPDPTALPPENELIAAFLDTAEKIVQRQIEGHNE